MNCNPLFEYSKKLNFYSPTENSNGDPEMDFVEWNADTENANTFIQVQIFGTITRFTLTGPTYIPFRIFMTH